jgi:hypothetical protein
MMLPSESLSQAFLTGPNSATPSTVVVFELYALGAQFLHVGSEILAVDAEQRMPRGPGKLTLIEEHRRAARQRIVRAIIGDAVGLQTQFVLVPAHGACSVLGRQHHSNIAIGEHSNLLVATLCVGHRPRVNTLAA